MNKLKNILENIIDGITVRGISGKLSLYDIKLLIDIYNNKIAGVDTKFFNSNILFVLDKCKIHYTMDNDGINYIVKYF